MSLPAIHYSFGANGDLLSDDGVPVWPLTDEAEAAAFFDVARLFGQTCQSRQRAQCSPRRSDHDEHPSGPSVASPEWVVGMGAEAQDAARLYAHLTRRHYRAASHTEDALADPRPAVLVTMSTRADAHLLSQISVSDHQRPVTGLVAAPTATGLRRQVLVRSAAAWGAPPTTRPRVDLWPLRKIPRIIGPDGRIFVGRKGDVEDVLGALQSDSSVLHVFTHSDGVDANLGEAVMCGLLEARPTPSGGPAPRCHLTGQCHRLDRTVDEALSSGRLVAPSRTRTRLLLWSTCLGLLPSDWAVDTAWNVGYQLLDKSTVGAAIMSWSITAQLESAARHLADLVASGIPVGAAMQRSVAPDVTEVPRSRRVLLGDPRVQVTPEVAVLSPPNLNGHSARPRPTTARTARSAIWRSDLPLLLGAGVRATGDLTNTSGPKPAWPPAQPANVSEGLSPASIVTRIAELGWATWLDAWTGLSERQSVSTQCPRCGDEVEAYDGVLPSGAVRSCRICTRCRSILDVPSGVEARLIHKPMGHLTLHWSPRGEWAGRVRISSAAQHDTQSHAWPTRAGRPAKTHCITPRLPIGPLRLSAILVDSTGPVVLTRID